MSLVLARARENIHMTKTQAIQPQQGLSPRGKIEILPNAIHTIAINAISQCYGVVGIAAPRLRNGQEPLNSAAMPWKVLITARTMNEVGVSALQLLRDANCDLVIPPKPGPFSADELLKKVPASGE